MRTEDVISLDDKNAVAPATVPTVAEEQNEKGPGIAAIIREMYKLTPDKEYTAEEIRTWVMNQLELGELSAEERAKQERNWRGKISSQIATFERQKKLKRRVAVKSNKSVAYFKWIGDM